MNEEMMTIRLKLESTLARHAPENASCYPVEPGTTVAGLMARLELRDDQVMLAIMNGQSIGHRTVLADGCTLSLLPHICGG
jgi:molybdopterin converting factor small subunit